MIYSNISWILPLIPFISSGFQINSKIKIRGTFKQISISPHPHLHSPTTTGNNVFSLKLTSSSSSSKLSAKDELDTSALLKYIIAVLVQMIGLAASFYMLDLGQDPSRNMQVWPVPVVFGVFFFLSLKSRTLNPLDNQRPDLEKAAKTGKANGFGDRIMPSWTPPGVFFPIMWVLIIAPLRSYSSLLVYEATGSHFFNITLLSLMLHLSIGDTWNTINNVEKRIGASVLGVLCVLSSALFASYQYYQVEPLAGKLLGCTCIWLTIASALITDTWRLNTKSDTGKRDSLFPVKGDAETKFFFESYEQ